MKDLKESGLIDILACPRCHHVLALRGESLLCTGCDETYPLRNGRPDFTGRDETEDGPSARQFEEVLNETLASRLLNIGKRIVSSEYQPRNHLRESLAAVGSDDIAVELGSGDRRLTDNMVCIDLFGFPNVDVIADVRWVPLKDSSVDLAVCDTVLEHVPQPHMLVDEIHRILKPGGKAVCFAPFIFPYHGYPKHYFNFSRDGLEFLFRNFSSCRIEMSIGPTSAITNLISEYLAIGVAGRHNHLYTVMKGLFLVPVFLFKFLDFFWKRRSVAANISSTLCVLAEK